MSNRQRRSSETRNEARGQLQESDPRPQETGGRARARQAQQGDPSHGSQATGWLAAFSPRQEQEVLSEGKRLPQPCSEPLAGPEVHHKSPDMAPGSSRAGAAA